MRVRGSLVHLVTTTDVCRLTSGRHTPKYSLCSDNDIEKSHAVVGERWLEKHLKDKEKTNEELAKTLWEDDLTAIVGVCPLSLYFFTY